MKAGGRGASGGCQNSGLGARGLSGFGAFALLGFWAFGLSGSRAFGLLGFRVFGLLGGSSGGRHAGPVQLARNQRCSTRVMTGMQTNTMMGVNITLVINTRQNTGRMLKCSLTNTENTSSTGK